MRERPVILHLDLDAFFSAVEQLHKPSLRGKPVVVGGIGGRGVVSTASYEARAFGIGSAMSIMEARRRCPNAAYLAPRFAAYRDASQVVMGLLRELSPLVEQVSVDEAYVDLSPTHPQVTLPEATELAAVVRAGVQRATGLTASIGLGTNKLIAKIGSELGKPNGLTVVAPGDERRTLATLPVRRLPGIGPASADRLRRRQISTVGELADTPLDDVVELLGQAHGGMVHRFAQGIDDRLVVPERDAKSVSAEETFDIDLTDRTRLGLHLRRLAERVAVRLVKEGISGRTVTLKLRRHDFTTLTRSFTLDQPTDTVSVIHGQATTLLDALDVSDGVRLLGVGVSGLTEFAQQDLFAELDPDPGPPPTPAEGETDPGETAGGESDGAETAEGETDGSAPTEVKGGAAAVPPHWRPGQDVRHADRGPGWVQGSGRGLVTIRFEGPHTPRGPIATFAVDDPALAPADPPVW